jgi:hypothetical protein
MKHCWLIVLFMLTITINAAQAQDAALSCDGPLQEPLAGIMPQVDYAAVCQNYQTCLASGQLDCAVQALLPLQADCTDEACQWRARLVATGLGLLDGGSYAVWGLPNADQFPTLLAESATAIQRGDAAGALTAAQAIDDSISLHPLLPIWLGLLQEAQADDGAAMNTYNLGMEEAAGFAIAHYMRGSFLVRLGRVDEAALDFALMEQYAGTDEATRTFIQSLTSQYPTDRLPLESMLVYPVLTYSGGITGTIYVDLSLDEPLPSRWARLDQGRLLVGQNLSPLLNSWYGEQAPRWLRFTATEGDVFRHFMGYSDDYGRWGVETRLDVGARPISLIEDSLQFESSSGQINIVASADQPDPRRFFAATRCAGGALSWLSVGAEGWTTFDYTTGTGGSLFDAPEGSPITDLGENSFTVLAGPDCRDGTAWWQVQSGEFSGWLKENDGLTYLAYPTERPALPPTCDTALMPRLSAGADGMVIVGQGANNVRSQPSQASELLGNLAEGSTFAVLEGPACADGMAWWRVQSADVTGWTAEGMDDTYWLQPGA